MEPINDEKSAQEPLAIELSDSMDNISTLLTHDFIPLSHPVDSNEFSANMEMVDAVYGIIEQAEETDESHEMQNDQRSRMRKPAAAQRTKTPTRARSTARKTRAKAKSTSKTRSTAKNASKSRSKSRSSSAAKAKPKSRKTSRGRSNSRRRN